MAVGQRALVYILETGALGAPSYPRRARAPISCYSPSVEFQRCGNWRSANAFRATKTVRFEGFRDRRAAGAAVRFRSGGVRIRTDTRGPSTIDDGTGDPASAPNPA